MPHVNEIEQPESDRVEAAVSDRRRPGRHRHVYPELIPLLRGNVAPAPEVTQFGDPDQLRPVRGLPLALGLSAALWAGIAYAGHLILS